MYFDVYEKYPNQWVWEQWEDGKLKSASETTSRSKPECVGAAVNAHPDLPVLAIRNIISPSAVYPAGVRQMKTNFWEASIDGFNARGQGSTLDIALENARWRTNAEIRELKRTGQPVPAPGGVMSREISSYPLRLNLI